MWETRGAWGFILVTNIPSGGVLVTAGLAGVAGRAGELCISRSLTL